VSDLTPTAGARFLLERQGGAGDARTTYRAVIFTPDAEYATTATLAVDGTFEVGTSDAPADLHDVLVMLVKLTARAAAKRVDDGLPAWPARLLRWRGPGRG